MRCEVICVGRGKGGGGEGGAFVNGQAALLGLNYIFWPGQ